MQSGAMRNALVIGMVAALAAAGIGIWRYAARGTVTPSVAVLPFTGHGDEPRYFTDGFHDAVVTQLARIQGLRVISRTSVVGCRASRASSASSTWSRPPCSAPASACA
jgi:hypothetical protein